MPSELGPRGHNSGHRAPRDHHCRVLLAQVLDDGRGIAGVLGLDVARRRAARDDAVGPLTPTRRSRSARTLRTRHGPSEAIERGPWSGWSGSPSTAGVPLGLSWAPWSCSPKCSTMTRGSELGALLAMVVLDDGPELAGMVLRVVRDTLYPLVSTAAKIWLLGWKGRADCYERKDMALNITDAVMTLIKIDLENLTDYIQAQEDALAEQLERFAKHIGEQGAQLSPSERKAYFEFYIDDYSKLDDTFPTLFRTSALIVIYGWYENQLNSICDLGLKAKNIPLTVQDLHRQGSIVGRAQGYLEKVLGVTFPKNKPYWASLIRYQEIRNCVVHSNGLVSSKVTKGWIERCPTAELIASGHVRLKQGFLEQVLKDLNSFFNDLAPILKRCWPPNSKRPKRRQRTG